MPLTLQAVPVADYEYVLSFAFGGGDGIIRGDGDAGEVVATDPVSMFVTVGTFRGIISHRIARRAASGNTAEFEAPTGGDPGDLRRIDLVQYTLTTGMNVVAGDESGSPEAPSVSDDSIPLAYIHHRNGEVSIKDTDDGSNGYIEDARQYV